MTATDRSLRNVASRELGTWLAADQPQRFPRSGGALPRDAGLWRGPTESAWMTTLLHGALPPRPSTGTPAEPPIAHG